MISSSPPRSFAEGDTNSLSLRACSGTQPAGTPVSKIVAQAATIRMRGRQRIAFRSDADEIVYVVRSGVFTLDASLPNDRHQILGLLYPGDVYRTSQMPPLGAAGITAVTVSGELLRLRWSQLGTLAESDTQVAQYLYDRLADHAARLAMHTVVIGSLTGEERVASLFIELEERIGVPVGDGIAFDILISRTDVADYLALNADTVSRIISRLRAKGLVTQCGRSRFICHDPSALASESPIAEALATLHRGAPGALAI